MHVNNSWFGIGDNTTFVEQTTCQTGWRGGTKVLGRYYRTEQGRQQKRALFTPFPLNVSTKSVRGVFILNTVFQQFSPYN